jgi:hypothetical protein
MRHVVERRCGLSAIAAAPPPGAMESAMLPRTHIAPQITAPAQQDAGGWTLPPMPGSPIVARE